MIIDLFIHIHHVRPEFHHRVQIDDDGDDDDIEKLLIKVVSLSLLFSSL